MSKLHFIATIDLGYVQVDVETTENNVGEPMIEFRDSGHSLMLTREGALILAETLKAAAIAK